MTGDHWSLVTGHWSLSYWSLVTVDTRREFYEELVRRNDIVAVAIELGLEVRGTKCRCLRPEAHAHGDRTPSLSLFRDRNTFRCWVCPDVRGDVIQLVETARGVSHAEAVRYLAARVGMAPP